MEPRRTPLCMLSGMLSSFLIFSITNCNESTYRLLFAPNPCKQKGASYDLSEFSDGDRGDRACRMTLDGYRRGVRSARAGWLARLLSPLDPELL